MKEHKISYCFLLSKGLHSNTLQRIRQDLPITTKSLGYLCRIMRCQPGDLLEYIDSTLDDIKG